MSPRPDRRPDSRPERGARRPAGGPPGRGPGRGPARPSGASFRPAAARRPRWGLPQGEGGSQGSQGDQGDRFRREGPPPPQGEWVPRPRSGPAPELRRSSGSRWEGRPADAGRPPQRRFEGRSDNRFERPVEGRFEPPRDGRATPERREAGSRFPAPRSRPAGRPAGPSRSAAGSTRSWEGRQGDPQRGPSRFAPRAAAEFAAPRRREGAGAEPSDATPQGDHFAAAAPSDLIWGRHSAQATLESGRPIHRIWCTPEMRFSPRFLQLLREAKSGGVLVEEVSWARLGQLSGGAVHQGIVLQPAAAETLDLPSLIEGCRGIGESPLLIAVDGLTDPQNLGAIVRSAEALGAHGMVLPQRRNAGLTGSVAKVAAGALEHLPVARVVNLNRSLDALRQEGYRVIGLAAEGTVSLEEADLDGPLVVVTGSEAEGLSLLTRRSCDQLVRIPLRGTTPSLNASVATALLLYEIARRSWMKGLRGTSPAPRLQRPALPSAPPPAAAAGSPDDTDAAGPQLGEAAVGQGLQADRSALSSPAAAAVVAAGSAPAAPAAGIGAPAGPVAEQAGGSRRSSLGPSLEEPEAETRIAPPREDAAVLPAGAEAPGPSSLGSAADAAAGSDQAAAAEPPSHPIATPDSGLQPGAIASDSPPVPREASGEDAPAVEPLAPAARPVAWQVELGHGSGPASAALDEAQPFATDIRL